MPNATKYGLTTINWGTSGLLTDTALTTSVVESMSATPKNGAPIEIEDNDGFAKALVILDDGFDATIGCLYDSAIAWPVVGATVMLQRPGDASPLACLLVSIENSTARKKEATLSMKLVYRPGITLT